MYFDMIIRIHFEERNILKMHRKLAKKKKKKKEKYIQFVTHFEVI